MRAKLQLVHMSCVQLHFNRYCFYAVGTYCIQIGMMPDQIEYSKNNGCNGRTKLEKILICSFPIFIILALLCLVGIAIRKSCKQEDVTEECKTSHCVKAAAELLEYIDLKKDPCMDFYKFVCGTYRKNAVKTDSTSPWASTAVLFRNELKSLVVDPISRKDTSAHVALKKFYRECMNETKIDFNENAAFMKAIDSLGGWPLIRTSWNASNFKWDDWYIKAKQLGLPLIGFLTFQKKKTETNGPLLAISGPRLGSIHSQYHFLELMKKLSAVFGVTYSEQDNIEVHNFITKLEEHRNVMDSDDTDEDSSKISNIQNLTTICPNVTWLKILNGLSGSNKFNNSSMISLNVDKMEKYCSMLEKLLQNTSSKVIANYYVWTIIENAHLFMDKYIRRAYEDVTYEEPDRFEFCYNIAKSRFKHVVESVYIRRKINRHVKPQIFEMVEILKELYAEHLQNSSWMDEETKSTAIRKAKAIDHLIGSIDEVYDVDKFDKILGVNKFKFTSDIMFQMLQQKLTKELHHFFETLYMPSDDWDTLFQNTMKVNAYFVMPLNLMIIPAPILTSIFYNRKFPAFMNYGAIGRTISHEFMHGFSRSSRLVIGPRGKIVNWWTDETTDNYDKKVKCVIDEYESIPFRYKLNGTLTLEENVADYVGADIGYEAYQRYVQKHGTEMKLPGVPLTPEQIYWVQTSTHSCFRKLDDNPIDYEEEDEHAIPSFRVQAPARNSIHFAQAFNCPIGSFMNPPKKCKIL